MKNIKFVAFRFLLLSTIIFTGCGSFSSNKSIPKNSFLVDVRSTQEFLEGSVVGSVNIPLNEIENRLDEFKDKSTIVVFCRSGSRASNAKDILEKNGFKNIINGGSWQSVNKQIK